MTIIFAENANNDPYIDPTTGDLAVLTDAPGNPAATAQLCKSRIEAQRKEMKYAMDQGMPMMDTAFNTFNPHQFEAAARTILMNTPNVTAVSSFNMYQDGNTLRYSATIDTTFGSAKINGVATQ
jgi:hypothetical protein